MTIKKKVTKKKSVVKKTVAKKPLKKVEKKALPAKKAPVIEKPAISKAPDGPVKVQMYSNKHYAEEYQVTGFHYAFVSSPKDGNRMCHWWVKCRDFLQDALRNQLTGRNDQIYGFAYRPKDDPPVDTETTRIMVKRIPKPASETLRKEFDEMMISGLKLINFYEKKYSFKPLSTITRVDHDDYPYLFVGPGVWSQGSVMISIYTFLIRLGYFKPAFTDEKSLMAAYDKIIGNGQQTNDTRYLRTVYKNLDPALVNIEKHLFVQKGKTKILFHDSNMSSFHHHSGIVSLSQFNTPESALNNEFKKIFSAK